MPRWKLLPQPPLRKSQQQYFWNLAFLGIHQHQLNQWNPSTISAAKVPLLKRLSTILRNFVGLPGLASIMSQGRGLLARDPLESRKCVRFLKLSFGNFNMNLNIPKLFFSHAKIVSQFVHECLADLMADFCLARTDGFDVLLVKYDVGWTCR